MERVVYSIMCTESFKNVPLDSTRNLSLQKVRAAYQDLRVRMFTNMLFVVENCQQWEYVTIKGGLSDSTFVLMVEYYVDIRIAWEYLMSRENAHKCKKHNMKQYIIWF